MSRRRKEYTEEDLQAALDEVWNGEQEEISASDRNAIADTYSIPHSTLRGYVSKGERNALRLGRKRLLPEAAEKELADQIISHGASGAGWGKDMIIQSARLMYQCLAANGLVPDIIPEFSDTWFDEFLSRYKISLKTTVKLSKARADALERTSLMCFQESIRKTVEKLDIQARNMWTCDETTSIPKGTVSEKCGAAKGTQVLSFKSPLKVPKFSLFCCGNVEGDTIPPQIIVPCSKKKRDAGKVPEVDLSEHMTDSEVIYTENGANTIEKFSKWAVDNFGKYSRQNRKSNEWTLLIMDNCGCHFDITLIRNLFSMKIILVYFPPNSTHVTSPLDLSIYGPLKTALGKSLSQRTTLSIKTLAEWVGPCIEQVFTPSSFAAGFRSAGLWNDALHGPDVGKVTSQYQDSIPQLPQRYKKASKERRSAMAIKEYSAQMEAREKQEEYKVEKCGGEIAGKQFVKDCLGGAVVSEQKIEILERKQQKLQKMAANKKVRESEALKKRNEAEKKKREAIKTKFSIQLKKERSLKKIALSDNRKLRRDLENVKTKFNKSKRSEDELLKVAEILSEGLQDEGVCADEIEDMLEEGDVDKSILKGKTSIFRKQNPKRKRRKTCS